MKARKTLVTLAAVMVLTVSSITINAIPALADESEERVQIEILENAVSETSESGVDETNDIETEHTGQDHIESDSTEQDYIESDSTGQDHIESDSTEQNHVENNDGGTDSSDIGITETAKSNTESRNWSKYEPCNELEISGDKLSGSIIAGKMTKHQPVVIWTKEPLSEDEQKSVWESLKGNPGVGNPSGVVYISGDEANSYGMTVNTATGKITFDNKSDWSLLYAGEYVRDNVPETDNTETVPEQNPELLPEKDPGNTPDYIPPQDPEPEKGPGVDVTEEPEKNQASENTAVDTDSTGGLSNADSSSVNGSTSSDNSNTVSDSGGSSGNIHISSGRSSSSGSSSGGPGAVHELDDVPETGTLARLSGRSLDEVPKTGMPEDFAILMAVSVAALILLTVVLLTEKKKERQNNRLNR